MKIIYEGGLSTKNFTSTTRDALILASNKEIDGIKLFLYLTVDNEIICLNEKTKDLFQKLGNINELEYKDLVRYNIGTRAKRHNIITLKEALEIFKHSNKILVLELIDQSKKNALFSDLILRELRRYQYLNILLESKSLEVFNYLSSTPTPFKTGLTIDDDSLDYLEVMADFYNIPFELIPKLDLEKRLDNQNLILIRNINSNRYKSIVNYYNKYSNYIYLVVKDVR